jgi:hypothetical protein
MNTDMPDATTHQCAHCVREQQARQKEVSEMKQWAQRFKLDTPIPRDVLSLMAKHDVEQVEIVMKNMSLGR